MESSLQVKLTKLITSIFILVFVLFTLVRQNSISNFFRLHQNQYLQWYYDKFKDAETIIYSRHGDIELKATLFYPQKNSASNKYPTMVYLFGGGWKRGGINQFYDHAIHFRNRNFLAILVDYRVSTRHSSTPLESVNDVFDLLEYIFCNYSILKVDTTRVYLVGASAGGHLALATTFFNIKDNNSLQRKIKGIILYSPVIKTTVDGYYFNGLDSILAYQLSPLDNIKSNAPPTLIFHGDEDPLIPLDSILKFQQLSLNAGNDINVVILPNMRHEIPQNEQFINSLIECESFVDSYD